MDFRIPFVIKGFCYILNCFLDNTRKRACLLIFTKIVSLNMLYFSFKINLGKSEKSNFIVRLCHSYKFQYILILIC